MTKIAFYTLGCRSNQYETDRMARAVAASGFDVVPYPGPADVYVINTCTVTGNAEKKSRHIIRHSKKKNPNAKIIVTGCAVERAEFSVEEIDMIINNKDKINIIKYLGDVRREMRDEKLNASPTSHLPSLCVRANLMIEDGCENFCSYCIVPFVRGKIKSKPVDEIITEAKEMVEGGVREIVLTGINLGEYRSNSPSPISSSHHLPSLINELSKIDSLLRIRLSSIEPMYITDELIDIVRKNPKVCKHFHIPLQSGDDGILKAMNRKYQAKDFLAMAKKIKEQIKDVAITTDIIVGFPGEDETAFKNTLKLVDMIKFSRIHIFPYSDRPGTEAQKLSHKINSNMIHMRHKRLDKLREKYMLEFHRSFKDQAMEVLIESKNRDTGICEGLTGNYIRVLLTASSRANGVSRESADKGDESIGSIISVKFRDFQGENVIAHPILV